MSNRILVAVVAAIALGVGVLLGTGREPLMPLAHASPTWDEGRSAYVTGDQNHLTFWRVQDNKVVEVTTYELGETSVKEGERGTARPVFVFSERIHRPAQERSASAR